MTKEDAEKQLQEVQSQIAILQEEEKRLKSVISDFVRDEKMKQYMEEIFQVTEENSMVVRLSSNTKTTPIMDKFYFSETPFLIFKRIFRIRNSSGTLITVSLVIKKGFPGDRAIDSGLTMTDLKKFAGAFIINNPYPERSRKYALVEELLYVAAKLTEDSNAIPFEHPIRLGGQTFSNQTGYGSEYNGNTLVSQGTLYGDTTGFYIIGVLV